MLRIFLVSLLTIILFTVFVSLGTWQLQRRAWKLDLISRVEAQLAKTPVAAPERDQWQRIGQQDAYLPVTITGIYPDSGETLVQAMTALGSGYWVISPLQRDDGSFVLINRGFVDSAHRAPTSRPQPQQAEPVTIGGLLRLSEPGGRVLRPNRPAENRWYSRDVTAIGKVLKLPVEDLAPYFIDANALTSAAAWPVGGLTVVKFRNTHLIYAITWYTLALLTLVATSIAVRKDNQTHAQ